MPIWEHGWDTAVEALTLPVFGLIGYVLMAWRSRREPERLIAWATIGLLAAAGVGLMMWQTRAGAAAQMLAVPGATALAWLAILWLMGRRLMLVRVFGVVVAFVLISGIATAYGTQYFNSEPLSEGRKAINRCFCRSPVMRRMVNGRKCRRLPGCGPWKNQTARNPGRRSVALQWR